MKKNKEFKVATFEPELYMKPPPQPVPLIERKLDHMDMDGDGNGDGSDDRPVPSTIFRLFTNSEPGYIDTCLRTAIDHVKSAAMEMADVPPEWIAQAEIAAGSGGGDGGERKQQFSDASKLYFVLSALKMSAGVRSKLGVSETDGHMKLVKRAFALYINGSNRNGKPPAKTSNIFAATHGQFILKLLPSIMLGVDEYDILKKRHRQQQ